MGLPKKRFHSSYRALSLKLISANLLLVDSATPETGFCVWAFGICPLCISFSGFNGLYNGIPYNPYIIYPSELPSFPPCLSFYSVSCVCVTLKSFPFSLFFTCLSILLSHQSTLGWVSSSQKVTAPLWSSQTSSSRVFFTVVIAFQIQEQGFF